MQDRTSLNFVVGRDFLVVHLLPGEDEALLWRRDSFFLFHALLSVFSSFNFHSFFNPHVHLNPLNFVGGFDVNLNFFSSQSFNLDQHLG